MGLQWNTQYEFLLGQNVVEKVLLSVLYFTKPFVYA